MPTLNNIHIRDPFILKESLEGHYFLYGTTYLDFLYTSPGFDFYRSIDLEEWSGPYPAFRPDGIFRQVIDFWAPEVHWINSTYYMLATMKIGTRPRGTYLLRANNPLGPFVPCADTPLTPSEWECLDGTLYTDQAGKHWLVFCHEWLQAIDGAIYALALNEHLDVAEERPIRLFNASEAAWTRAITFGADPSMTGYVTDAPYLHRTVDNRLLMLWSSFSETGYSIGIAESSNNEITGAWTQRLTPLLASDGGHSMLFRDKDFELQITFHQPNIPGRERAQIFKVDDQLTQIEREE